MSSSSAAGILLGLPECEDEGTVILQNVGKCLPESV